MCHNEIMTDRAINGQCVFHMFNPGILLISICLLWSTPYEWNHKTLRSKLFDLSHDDIHIDRQRQIDKTSNFMWLNSMQSLRMFYFNYAFTWNDFFDVNSLTFICIRRNISAWTRWWICCTFSVIMVLDSCTFNVVFCTIPCKFERTFYSIKCV